MGEGADSLAASADTTAATSAADRLRGGSVCWVVSTIQPMTLEWEQTTVDADDPAKLGNWWREALGWEIVNDDPEAFEIQPEVDRLPGLLFVRASDAKVTKNRLHLDFRPDDQAREVDRLLDLGASRVDIGQGRQPWVVLADPEGNEFCVLGSAAH